MLKLEERYWGSFALCSVVCLVLHLLGRKATSLKADKEISTISSSFSKFQLNFLTVYTLAMFSDSLQGPYVYELYVSYGFSQQKIAELFVCGFGSSLIVGTFVGGLADKYGRKFMCIMYSVFYTCACCTKLFPHYWILMIGRFLSGISTSLLFSVFESWMVCEHNKLGFDSNLIADTFSNSTFCNGLSAVLAGLIANTAAESHGYVAPFMVAILPLFAMASLVSTSWPENYGNQQQNVLTSLTTGFELIKRDYRIAALGLSQSCFEGAMYTFVFMWTPALKTTEEANAELLGTVIVESTSKYLGLIFAVFMVCVMVGSSTFKLLSTRREMLYKIPLIIHFIAFASMAFATLYLEMKHLVYIIFLVFEITIGMFYPSYGVIKAETIPEEIRSSVMNIFRMPLNGFVVILLLKIEHMSHRFVFIICTIAHAIAFISYLYFYISSKKAGLLELAVGEKLKIEEYPDAHLKSKLAKFDASPSRVHDNIITANRSQLPKTTNHTESIPYALL